MIRYLFFLLIVPCVTLAADAWKVGAPIVTYWAGPGFPGGTPLDDAAAIQLAEGGWNFVWCNEKELDVAQRHGLRGLLSDSLLTRIASGKNLDDPKLRELLDALIERVKKHPALYAYHLRDEPSAGDFPALGKAVVYLRERDPAHLSYINIYPTYANNGQLGTTGNTTDAYREHLRQYIETVQPGLISYDHYQFMNSGDSNQYFLNLVLVREKSLAAGLPFLNIVQASNWRPNTATVPSAPRVPNGDEMRYLVYTTLAYGAQGISYYVYCYPKHEGGIALPDRTPTPLYHALKPLNKEFVAIAEVLQPLKSLGAYHTGMLPPGAAPLPVDAAIILDPPVPNVAYKADERVQGVLIGSFGAGETATHFVVVNLDYKAARTVGIRAAAPLELFDAASQKWIPVNETRVELNLPGGSGKLIRLRK